MRVGLLIVLLSMAACSTDGAHIIVMQNQRQDVIIPPYLLSCPKDDVKIPPLPSVRTTDQLAAYANKLSEARDKLKEALVLCDSRRQQLVAKLRG